MPTCQICRTLPFSPQQLFDIAADVERYPEFLPGWISARVYRRQGDVYYTDQVLRFSVFRERFSSRTALQPPARIDVTSTDGPFRFFELTWTFQPEPRGLCRVALTVSMIFHSRLVETAFGAVVESQIGALMSAFERWARTLYARQAVEAASGGRR